MTETEKSLKKKVGEAEYMVSGDMYLGQGRAGRGGWTHSSIASWRAGQRERRAGWKATLARRKEDLAKFVSRTTAEKKDKEYSQWLTSPDKSPFGTRTTLKDKDGNISQHSFKFNPEVQESFLKTLRGHHLSQDKLDEALKQIKDPILSKANEGDAKAKLKERVGKLDAFFSKTLDAPNPLNFKQDSRTKPLFDELESQLETQREGLTMRYYSRGMGTTGDPSYEKELREINRAGAADAVKLGLTISQHLQSIDTGKAQTAVQISEELRAIGQDRINKELLKLQTLSGVSASKVSELAVFKSLVTGRPTTAQATPSTFGLQTAIQERGIAAEHRSQLLAQAASLRLQQLTEKGAKIRLDLQLAQKREAVKSHAKSEKTKGYLGLVGAVMKPAVDILLPSMLGALGLTGSNREVENELSGKVRQGA